MADKIPVIDFDLPGARRAGYTDDQIADFLASQVDLDIAAAREAGWTDRDIIAQLTPARTPAPKVEQAPAPKKAGIGDDLKRGLLQAQSDSQMLGATVAGRRLSEIEAAKAKADRGEPLTPWERAQASQYDEAKANTQRQFAETTGTAIDKRREADKLPISPEYKAFKDAGSKGFGEVISAFWKAPGEVLTSLLAESAVATAPSLLAAAGTGIVGGAAVAGGQAYLQGYASKVAELLAEKGVDLNDRQAVMAALSDPRIADEIRSDASLAAIPQSAAAAASMGVAGKVLAPASLATRPVAQQAVNIPAQAAAQGALEAAGEAGSNVVLGEEIEGGKVAIAGIGGASQGPIDAAVFAGRRAVEAARARPRDIPETPAAPTPEQAAAEVMRTDSVDEAIAVARETVSRAELDETVAGMREYGIEVDRQQADILDLWGGLNQGEVQRDASGNWFYQTDSGTVHPLRVWDGQARPDTISPALAEAQRAAYAKLGVEVVYFDGVPRDVGFDGAVDPNQPDTIFLSTDPTRNAAMVGAHELTHVLESTVLPDGTSLADLLHQQVKEGLTAEGRAYAEQLFESTAPKREAFPSGPEGDSLHADAVSAHYIREMAADIGAEAPKFQTFLPRVIDAVQTRYGADTAKDVLQRLMAGIRETMARLREFFFRPDEMAEYGQPPTSSQNWVTNLEQIHDTLARMYADRYGNAAQRENLQLVDQQDRAARDRLIRGEEQPATDYSRLATYRRWLGDLDRERRDAARTSPEAAQLQKQIDTILRRVQGDESKLTPTAAGRLEAARLALDAMVNPVGDSPEMARIRAAIEGKPAAAPVAPEQQVSEYDRAVREERERLWTEEMPGRKRGRPHNERMVTDSARETVMRRETGADLDWYLENGLQQDQVYEVARLYRRKDGQTPREALDQAVDRFTTKAEATALRYFGDEDLARWDSLKAESGSDPVMAEVFERLEEFYTGRPKELPGDEDIPIGQEPTRAPEVARGEVAPPPAERPEGGEAGARPRDRSEAPAAPNELTPEAIVETQLTKERIDGQVAEARETTNTEPTDGQRRLGAVPAPINGGSGYAKLFGDGVEAETLRDKGFEALSRDGQEMMIASVRRAINDEKILKSVVQTVPVDVMHMLVGKEITTQRLLNDPAMLTGRLSVSGDVAVPQPVVRFVDALSAAIVGDSAGARAEEPGLRGGPRKADLPDERGAAEQAGGADVWHGTVAGQEVSVNTNPSEAQKEAGNYRKGSVRWNGLELKIENPKGSTRSGVDGDGKRWEATLPADYGYLSRTEGADGDQVDAYIGPRADSQRVWVVDQIDPKTGRFDEHKIMLGTRSVTEARAIYHRAFSDGTGPKRIGAITEMSLDQLKGWLRDGDTTRPVGEIKAPAPAQKERAKLEAKRRKPAKPEAAAPNAARATDEFFTYKPDSPTPSREDAIARGAVPEGTTDKEWQALSPGMRREIVRTAEKRTEPKPEVETGQDRPELAKSGQSKQQTTAEAPTDTRRPGGEPGIVERASDWLGRALGRGGQKVEVPDWMERSFEVAADMRRPEHRDLPQAERWALEDRLLQRYGVDRADYARYLERTGRLSQDESTDLLLAMERRNREQPFEAPATQRQRRGPATDVVEEAPAQIEQMQRVADDGPKFSPRIQGIPREAAAITTFRSADDIKKHADYREAKAGGVEAAARLVVDLVRPAQLERARLTFGQDALFVPVVAQEATGHNAIPLLLARLYAEASGGDVARGIRQTNRAFHTGADAMERMLVRPEFDGPVEAGRNYVLVDDVSVLGGTLAGLANHIQQGGGRVVGVVTLANASRSGEYTPRRSHVALIERRFGDEVRDRFGVEPSALTADEAQYLVNFRDVDALRTRGANAERERSRRLREKGLLASEAEEGGVARSEPSASTPGDETGTGQSKQNSDGGSADKGPKFSPRQREPELSPEYAAALEAHNEASRTYNAVLADYRAGRVADDEFIAAKRRYAEATRIFDEAFAKEADRKPAPETTKVPPPDRQGTLFSPRITGSNPTRRYTPEQLAAFERTGRAVRPRSIVETIAQVRADLGKKLVREIFDPYVGLRERDPEGYLAARMANSSTGAVDMFNTWGTLRFRGNAYDVDQQTGGVVDLIRRLGPEAHDFLSWVAANRAERLKAEDRENLFTDDDIAAMKALNQGTLETPYELSSGETTTSREAAYLDALQRYDVANKNVQDLAVEAGLLKRDVVDELWANPFYVPFYRVPEGDNSRAFVGPSSVNALAKQIAGKRLLGGTEKLNANLWENAFGNWAHMIDAAIRNRAANRVLETAAEHGIARPMSEAQYANLTKAEKASAVWTMREGKKTYWLVDDPFTLKAVAGLDYLQSGGPLMAIGRAAKKILQVGVAADPMFQVRNLIRDTTNSVAVSPIAKNVFRNLYEGTRQQDVPNALMNVARAVAGRELEPGRIGRETAAAVAGGATMRYAAGVDQSFRKADTYLDSDEKVAKFWQYFRRVGQSSMAAMGFSENINRLALYKQLGEQKVPHDLRAYEGRDLSDFTLVGASPIIRHLVELVPYMNAWMQGLYKVGRAATESDRSVALAVGGKVTTQIATRLAFVMLAMTALDLALHAIYEDDEDYRNRNEYDRNANFWFKVGGTEYRIPRGFEVAALSRLGTIWLQSLYDRDMTVARAWKNTLQIVGTQMAFNPTPQIIKPVLDLRSNQTRTGAPIETMDMERLRPEYRYRPETTLVSRGISEAMNKAIRAVGGQNARGLSPVELDYLAQAYAGWLGTSALQIADTAVRAASNEPSKPAKDLIGTLTRGMITNDRTYERSSGFYVNMLYQQGDAIKEAYATYRDLARRGRLDEARDYFASNRDLIARYPIFERVTRAQGELNRQIRAVGEDFNLTPEQKRLRIMRLNRMKTQAAEAVFRAAPP